MNELTISLKEIKKLNAYCKKINQKYRQKQTSACDKCKHHELCNALYIIADEMYELPECWHIDRLKWGINRANEVLNNE